MLEVVPHDGYEETGLRNTLHQHLAASGALEALRQRGPRVLLKPNFVMPAAPDDPSTTHPAFYMAIATLLQDEGFRVGIGESPAFGSCAKALAAHGVLDECVRRDIRVVEFKTPRAYPGIAAYRFYRSLRIAREIGEWDSLVNLQKLKTHRQFVFTGATKNLYGCVVGKRKFIRHNLCANDPQRFAQMLLANARAANCALHIGDGIEAMHVLGPRGGAPFALGAILIADDPLAHDLAMCRLINLDAGETPLFQCLSAAEMGQLETDCIGAIAQSGLAPARDFVHAPQIHISFSPWAVARSGFRTLRYKLGFAG